MLLSSWAAGIFTASPHGSGDEGVAAAIFIENSEKNPQKF